MEINKTLLMGKTAFEMRGNLNKKEPVMLEKWEQDNLYQLLLEKNKGGKEYMLHDGPPYANGDMHCGHMLNRILKDIAIRFKAMQGYYTPFIPGWDTHGLPIENAVTKSGVNRKAISPIEFRLKCEEYAKKQVERQMAQVKRLGILGDFENRYVTLDKKFEKSQIEIFAKMALRGLIYKGLKPVYYSPSSESALAEAEIEYKDVKSKTIFVRFRVIDGKGILTPEDFLVIWTTTPWTIPANLAICLNPDLEYGLYDTDKGRLVFLTVLKDSLMKNMNLERAELIKTFKGSDLEYVTTKHPLYDRESVVILGDHVTADAGTGCVHTAPGHGEDDFIVGRKYNLPPYCPVDEHGMMDETSGDRLKGLFYEEANDEVIVMLQEEGALLGLNEIVHSYPHDWRTNKPLIFRATPQWFCSIDKIRDQLLEEIDRVKWTPSWGKLRMHNMIKDRGDWCISRQRAWGVPIPIIYNEDGSPIMEEKVFNRIAELIGEHGSNIWFELSAKELLPEGYHNPLSPNDEFRKETDIMDVWFDSGSSFNGVVRARGYKYPADLYLEGSDQYRGWFNSSLIIAVATTSKAPYENVVSHGFVLDGNGNKMSKSLGNGIDPNKIINIYGADVLRLWTATVDYQADVRISEELVKQVSESYRKIRNTFKFMLANLADSEGSFDYDTMKVSKFNRISSYILATLEKVKNTCLECYEKYDYANAIAAITSFLTADVSSFYLSIAKDPLYCDKQDSALRREIQTVMYEVTLTVAKLLAPVLSFTMEEVYQNIPGAKKKYLVLEDMVKESHDYDSNLLKEYEQFKEVRALVMKALENARSTGLIGSSLEAKVQLSFKDESVLNIFNDELWNMELLFIVSKVEILDELEDAEEFNGCKVKVLHHEGKKCERCWAYFDELEEVEENHVCSRCYEVIKGE